MPRISLVIPAYNEANYLPRLLDTIDAARDRFSGGRDIIVLALDDDGNVTESVTGVAGLNVFTQPLDIAQDPASGCLYVADYQGERLSMLRPITDESRLADMQQHIFRQQVRASAAE